MDAVSTSSSRVSGNSFDSVERSTQALSYKSLPPAGSILPRQNGKVLFTRIMEYKLCELELPLHRYLESLKQLAESIKSKLKSPKVANESEKTRDVVVLIREEEAAYSKVCETIKEIEQFDQGASYFRNSTQKLDVRMSILKQFILVQKNLISRIKEMHPSLEVSLEQVEVDDVRLSELLKGVTSAIPYKAFNYKRGDHGNQTPLQYAIDLLDIKLFNQLVNDGCSFDFSVLMYLLNKQSQTNSVEEKAFFMEIINSFSKLLSKPRKLRPVLSSQNAQTILSLFKTKLENQDYVFLTKMSLLLSLFSLPKSFVLDLVKSHRVTGDPFVADFLYEILNFKSQNSRDFLNYISILSPSTVGDLLDFLNSADKKLVEIFHACVSMEKLDFVKYLCSFREISASTLKSLVCYAVDKMELDIVGDLCPFLSDDLFDIMRLSYVENPLAVTLLVNHMNLSQDRIAFFVLHALNINDDNFYDFLIKFMRLNEDVTVSLQVELVDAVKNNDLEKVERFLMECDGKDFTKELDSLGFLHTVSTALLNRPVSIQNSADEDRFDVIYPIQMAKTEEMRTLLVKYGAHRRMIQADGIVKKSSCLGADYSPEMGSLMVQLLEPGLDKSDMKKLIIANSRSLIDRESKNPELLHRAIVRNCLDLVSILIECNISDLSKPYVDKKGEVCPHIAVALRLGLVDVSKYLIEKSQEHSLFKILVNSPEVKLDLKGKGLKKTDVCMPLILALRTQQMELARFLIQNNARERFTCKV